MKKIAFIIACTTLTAFGALKATNAQSGNVACKIGKIYQSELGHAFDLDNCSVPPPTSGVPNWPITGFYYLYSNPQTPSERDLASTIAFAKASSYCVDVIYDDATYLNNNVNTVRDLYSLGIMPLSNWASTYAYKFKGIALKPCP